MKQWNNSYKLNIQSNLNNNNNSERKRNIKI